METPHSFLRRVSLIRIALTCLVIALAGCERGPGAADLPLLARPAIDDALPVVRDQIGAALAQVDKSPTNAAANGRLAMTLHAYLYLDAAEVAYHRARLLDPRSERWAYLHGVTLVALGQTDRAVDAFRAALDQDPKSLPINLQLAQTLDASGNTAAAREIAEALVSDHPASAEAHHLLGRVLNSAGEPQLAETHLRRALDLGGPFGAGYYALAGAYRAQGKEADAAAALVDYAKYRATTLARTDPHMGAVQALDRSTTRLVQRAKGLHAAGQVAEAVTLLEEAIANDPDNSIARATLVALYGEAQRFDLVDEQFNAAVKLAPDLAELYYNLGIARAYEGRNVEAIRAYQQALKINPLLPDGHMRIGLVYAAQGRRDKAIAAYNDALRIAPGYAPAHQMLGDLHYTAGDLSAAKAHYEILAEQPAAKTPELLQRLARCYIADEQTQPATRVLHEALALAQRQQDTRLVTKIERALQALGETP